MFRFCISTGSALYIRMACTLSNVYIPASVSTCSIPISAKKGAFFASCKRLPSNVALTSSNQRRAKGVVVRAESSKEGAIDVHNTNAKEVVEQKPRAVDRATEISPFGKPLAHKFFPLIPSHTDTFR